MDELLLSFGVITVKPRPQGTYPMFYKRGYLGFVGLIFVAAGCLRVRARLTKVRGVCLRTQYTARGTSSLAALNPKHAPQRSHAPRKVRQHFLPPVRGTSRHVAKDSLGPLDIPRRRGHGRAALGSVRTARDGVRLRHPGARAVPASAWPLET